MKYRALLLLIPVLFACTPKEHFADFVDTSIGVGDKRGSHCVIGPMMPYGSSNPSPNTYKGDMSGYKPDQDIVGFAQNHVSGTGWSSYGHFLVSPQTGELEYAKDQHRSPQSNVVSKPYYFSVDLDRYGIQVEVAPTHYAAIYRFTYPQGSDASLLFDACWSVMGDVVHKGGKNYIAEASYEDGEIRMMLHHYGGWPEAPYKMYFVGKIDKKPVETGSFNGDELLKDVNSTTLKESGKTHIGVYAKFDTSKDTQVLLKMAFAFGGYDKASELLDSEIKGWNFEKVKNNALKVWDEKLSCIEMETPCEEDKLAFYAGLYRAFTFAHDRSADNQWNSGVPYWDDNYAIWDTFRTVYPLLNLVDKETARDNILCFIDRQKNAGLVSDTFCAGVSNSDEQGGNDVDHVIAEAYLKGIEGVDWEEAYKVVKFDADERRIGTYRASDADTLARYRYKELGWIPECTLCGSQSLEFCYNDYSAALMAQGLGHEDDAQRWFERSHKWEELWNADLESLGYKGFIDAKRADGSFVGLDPATNFGSWESAFYEAESWTYSVYMPHDIDRLIELCGGAEAFAERLNFGFENKKINFSNEPGFLCQKAFCHAGRPDLASYWGHFILKKPYMRRGYPGNDDTGAMGSWYVFTAMGLFPCAGQDFYYLSAPQNTKTVVRMGGGKTLTIIADAAPEKVYVKSCKVNGKEWNSSIIKHSDIKDGATIEFELSDTPTDWAK